MTAVNASNPSTQALAAPQLAALDAPASAASTSQAKRVGPGSSGPPKDVPPAPAASNRRSQLSPEQLAKAATDAGNAFLDERDVLPKKLHDIQYSTTIPTQAERNRLEENARAWLEHLKQSAIHTAQYNLDAQLKKHPTEVHSAKEHPEVTRARGLLEQALETPLGIAEAAERKVLGKFKQFVRANEQLKAAKQGSPEHKDAQDRANKIAAELPGDARNNMEAWSAAQINEIATNGDTEKARLCQRHLDAAKGYLDRAEKLAPAPSPRLAPAPSSAPNVSGLSEQIDAEMEKYTFRRAKEIQIQVLVAFKNYEDAKLKLETVEGNPHTKRQLADARNEVATKAMEWRDTADANEEAWALARPRDGRVNLLVNYSHVEALRFKRDAAAAVARSH